MVTVVGTDNILHARADSGVLEVASYVLFYGVFLVLYYRYLKKASGPSESRTPGVVLAERMGAMNRRLGEIHETAAAVGRRLDSVGCRLQSTSDPGRPACCHWDRQEPQPTN